MGKFGRYWREMVATFSNQGRREGLDAQKLQHEADIHAELTETIGEFRSDPELRRLWKKVREATTPREEERARKVMIDHARARQRQE